ncbi:tyrosine-protein kinase Srms [Pseudophryne corroboree]|uniref:tyrosine-protein kinase Srms n=1 Tax=Pseudophryne corroboree TaxID=495146 RepID=UPI0030814B41
MEAFFREYLSWIGCLWDKIWPPSQSSRQPTVSTIHHPASVSLPSIDIVTVLYDFNARDINELSVQEGEELCKVRDDGDYIMARKMTGTMDMGLVPANYVALSSFSASPAISTISSLLVSDSLQNHYIMHHEPWYTEVSSRYEAERLLLLPPNASGSYLIRPSDTNPGQYSLSVRIENKVTHFRIQENSKGEFYLQNGRSFPTIQDLLTFHKTNWKLLKGPLLQPCVTEVAVDNWERPRSEFKMIRKLGQGFFGEVFEGIWNDQQNVAIKTFKQDSLEKSDFEKEITALKSLCHRNLIQLLAVCSIGEPVYIVTELMIKGNLNSYLKSVEGSGLKSNDFNNIIGQVADGMEYLEKKHVVHRDLATRNVLVGENLICKIADFGLARLLKDDLYSPEHNQQIPIRWTAPEALTHCKYSTKSDVWSFGIVIYEVYTFGELPYKGMSHKEIISKVTNEGYRLSQPSNCSMEMYNLMLTCWMTKPNERPSFQELVEKLTAIQRLVR